MSALVALVIMAVYGLGGVLAVAAGCYVYAIGLHLIPRAHARLEVALAALAVDWRWAGVRADALQRR